MKKFLLSALLCATPFLASAADFEVTSPQLKDGVIANAQVFNSFGCTGDNISPELRWSNAPEGTKSFAVTVYDPDAPTGSGWWHWVVFNIPADVNVLQAGAGTNKDLLPKGAIQSLTDFGVPGYGGPCPPVGDKPHRYIFTVYALSTTLDLNENSMPALVGFSIMPNVLAKSTIELTFGRNK